MHDSELSVTYKSCRHKKTPKETVSLRSKYSRKSEELRLLVARKLRREEKLDGDGSGEQAQPENGEVFSFVWERLVRRLRVFKNLRLLM